MNERGTGTSAAEIFGLLAGSSGLISTAGWSENWVGSANILSLLDGEEEAIVVD